MTRTPPAQNIGWAGRGRGQPAARATECAYAGPGSTSLCGGQWTMDTMDGEHESPCRRGHLHLASMGTLAGGYSGAAVMAGVEELTVGVRARCAAGAAVGSPGLSFGA